MTAVVQVRRRGIAARSLGAARSGVAGTLLCLTPVTSLIALGWLSRRMAGTVALRTGGAAAPVGWVMGPVGQGRIVRLAGGLGANIAAGTATLAGMAVLTLPFTLLWLGAWWAGWQNSFTKGYEYAAVGPSVFLAGTALAAVALTVVPLALAHQAVEGRWAAMLELRRVRSVARAAGWRLVWLAVLTFLFGLPLMALQGLPGAMVGAGPEDWVPDRIEALKRWLALAGAAWAFTGLVVLREAAARAYAFAAPRAAAARPVLWQGAAIRPAAAEVRLGRVRPLVWFLLAVAVSVALSFQIVVAQFLNYGWWHWITHPAFLLPWAG